jgi:hypothetical protein
MREQIRLFYSSFFCRRRRFIVARQKLQRGFRIMENKRI